MLFFVLYLITACSVSYLLGSFFNDRNRKLIIFLSLIVLLTPAQISKGSSEYAPALFTFVFNLILEEDYSIRVLRPLILSIPTSLFIGFVVLKIRKRFF